MANKHPMPAFVWLILDRNVWLSGKCVRLHVPMRILSDFHAHYVLYDEEGQVKQSARTFLGACRIRKETGLLFTRLMD